MGVERNSKGDVKLRRDLMFAYIVTLVSLSRVLGVKGRVSEQEKNNIIGEGPQQYLLHSRVGKILMTNWGINCTSLFAVR